MLGQPWTTSSPTGVGVASSGIAALLIAPAVTDRVATDAGRAVDDDRAWDSGTADPHAATRSITPITQTERPRARICPVGTFDASRSPSRRGVPSPGTARAQGPDADQGVRVGGDQKETAKRRAFCADLPACASAEEGTRGLVNLRALRPKGPPERSAQGPRGTAAIQADASGYRPRATPQSAVQSVRPRTRCPRCCGGVAATSRVRGNRRGPAAFRSALAAGVPRQSRCRPHWGLPHIRPLG